MTRTAVGDVFARSSEDGTEWTIGTDAVEVTYTLTDGNLALTGFRNKLASPPVEYIPADFAAPPVSVAAAGGAWVLTHADASEATAGGQPVVQLSLDFACAELTVGLRVIAYPGTWFFVSG